MSYLDNLENSLKALESQEERDPARLERERLQRQQDRDAAARRAPFVLQLKSSPFTGQLLGACRRLGQAAGVYVQITWVEDSLRLQARDCRVDLQPTADGVVAVFATPGGETHRSPVDLGSDGEAFAKTWIESLPA